MKIYRIVLCLAGLGSCVVAAVSLRAAETFQDPKWALLDTPLAVSNAATITIEKYPDCDEATVDDRKVQVYQPDGTGEAQEESFTKVLTEKGKRNNRTLSFGFMLPYDTVEAVKAEVIKPDGRVVPVDLAANSKETIDDGQMGMNIYDPNSKVLKVNLPGLEVGDLVHQVVRTHTLRPYIPGEFADYVLFEYPGLIRHQSYEVYAPAERPLRRIALKDEVPGTVHYATRTETNGVTVHRWEVNEVPRMFDEPEMPPYSMVLQRLLVSTSPDWQFVSKWYADLCRSHLEAITPEMKQKVAELTAATTNDQQRIEAIFHFVSHDIRYMGITVEKDRPGFEPHDVNLTFDNKYGVCRDKAALLVALLRTAGFKAYPVLVSAGQRLDDEVPMPFFNHAISAVELKPGEYVLMDSTDENTKDLLPSYLCHQSYLVCKPDGDILRLSPVIPAEANLMQVKTTATLDASGHLAGRSELRFAGINDNIYRQSFARAKSGDIRHFFETRLKAKMSGARLKSLRIEPEDMQDTSKAIQVELEFAADGTVAAARGQAVTSLPMIGEVVGAVNYLLQGTGLEKRKYPLQIASSCGIHEEVEIQLGPGFTNVISLPTSVPVEDDSLAYRLDTTFTNGSLKALREFKIKTVEFSPVEYLKLKATLKAMAYDQRKAPVLALAPGSGREVKAAAVAAPEPPVPSDVEILESRKLIDVNAVDAMRVRLQTTKRVLTYAGKKRESELKITYNPAWQDAKLLRATVISPTGLRQEANTNEINVMDAPWSASAKRYTGSKIMVISLPGVDLGSIIETEYELSSRNSACIGGFEGFQALNQIDAMSTELRVTNGVKVQRVLAGKGGLVREALRTGATGRVYQWSATNVAALPLEPDCPQPWTYLPGVVFHVGDADVYWKKLNAILQERAGHSLLAAAKARELVAGKTPKAAAVAIRDFVARSIRTAGPSFLELPLEELSAADTTLADGYGHNADKAILLHAMLTAAGFKPDFIMVSGLEDIASTLHKVREVPMPQLFGTVLVSLKVDGEVCYLNDTDQYAHLGSLAASGHFGIRLADQSFEFVAPTREGRDRQETVNRLTLGTNGNARVTVTRSYYGVLYDEKNRFFSELPPEERRRYYQESATALAQGAVPVGELVTHFEGYPGTEELTVDIDQYAVIDGGRLLFNLPYQPGLRWSGLDHRTLPLLVGLGPEDVVRTEIEWPAEYSRVILAPPNEKLSAPDHAGKARIVSGGAGGKWVIIQETQKHPAIIEPDDYPGLLRVQSTMDRLSSKVFLLEQK